jgi:cholesterol transport system auxiliary component
MQRRFLIGAPLALAGCSVLPAQKYVARTDWPLDPPPPPMQPANPAGPVLLVRDLLAAPGLDDQGIRTLLPNGSLDIGYYNRWAVPPADAATQALANWLLASGDFSAVIAPGSRLTATLILEGELTEFLADESAGRATAVLTLVVISNSGSLAAKSRPLAQSRITGQAPLTGTDAASSVTALRAALASALGQAVALVSRYSS